MRILVTFAVEAEFSPWHSWHPFVGYEFRDDGEKREFDLFRANIGPSQVSVLLTGMGKKNANRAMQSISAERYDLCISTGLAGGLDARLSAGDTVVARTAKTIDGAVENQSDSDLARIAVSCGAVLVDVFLSSETIVGTASEKHELEASGAVVEMESSHILDVCKGEGLPAVAVRAISDTVDDDLPIDFQRVADSRGHLQIGNLLKELARRPYQLAALLRFGKQSRAAASSLADFLDRYIPAVEKHWNETIPLRAREASLR